MKKHIMFVLAISLLMFIVVGLDIPVLRQIVSFIYILFIPGFVFQGILKLEKVSAVDVLLLSVGLSLALLMFIGFLINELYPLFGLLKPLSTLPLMLTLTIITVVFSIISYPLTNKFSSSLTNVNKNILHKALFLISIPILAVCGAWFNNSYILLLMIAAIAVLVIATVFSKRLVPPELYSLVTVVIAISLLVHMSLISKYLTGWDIFSEYYVFRLTSLNSFWNVHLNFNNLQLSSYNAMASITVLPTFFSSLLEIQEEWIFKIVYPIIFSFVPLILYRTWEKQTGRLVAVLSAFFFIFSPKFYDTSEMRQIIAEIFLALLFFLIVNKKIKVIKKGILLVIFGAALVISHYSTSYIFLFTIAFAWFFAFISKSAKSSQRTISLQFVLLFSVIAFSWYTYVTSAPTDALWGFINNVLNSFSTGFFNLESRGGAIYGFANPLLGPSFLHIVDNFLAKIPYVFILIGFLGLFIRRMKNTEMRFDREYSLMMMANAVILSAVILLPAFGPGLVTARFFHITLFLLAPLSIVGGQIFFKWVKKLIFQLFGKIKPSKMNKSISFVCVVLVIIFLFKTGFLYEITGDVPSSPSLSKSRLQMSSDIEIKTTFFDFYVPEQDIFSAVWISKMIEEDSKIYADDISKLKVLVGYGMVSRGRIYTLDSNATIDTHGYMYLRYENVIDRHLKYLRYETERTEYVNITEVSSIFGMANKIYSNGFSEVYQSYTYLNMTER